MNNFNLLFVIHFSNIYHYKLILFIVFKIILIKLLKKTTENVS